MFSTSVHIQGFLHIYSVLQMHNPVVEQQWEIVKLSHHKDFCTEILSGEAEQWAEI